MDCVPQWLKRRTLTGLDIYRADPYASHIVRLNQDYVTGVLDADDVRLHIDACVDDGVFTQEQANDVFLITVGGLPVQCCSDRMPYELYIPDGPIGALTEWIIGNMSRYQPEFALMASLQAVAAALARRVKSDMGDATNLYQFLIGPSASGKDWPLKAVCDALISAGGSGLVGSGSLTSATAGLAQLSDNPAILFPIDEA